MELMKREYARGMKLGLQWVQIELDYMVGLRDDVPEYPNIDGPRLKGFIDGLDQGWRLHGLCPKCYKALDICYCGERGVPSC